jgi:phosphocarrier protein HPr
MEPSVADVYKSIVVQNKYGLHMRPAHRFMELANQFPCKVKVKMGHREVSGKSILDLTTLGAQCGATLMITCSGEQAEECLAALVQFVDALPGMYGEK